ncbi:putative uncharacterized protein [Clostridium sp. CAG:465]|jgi:hypothetical protein|nr:putative uncharacterized protein [Clostridium sp. CAG:465]
MKEKKGLGIASMVLGIIAIICSLIYISIPLALLSIILGIISLVKKQKKAFGIAGIILSAVSIIITILWTFFIIFIAGKPTLINEENIKSNITELYNDISEGITDDLDVENKIKGNKWMASDGSVLELKDDGTYYWYEDENDKSDNYYEGEYTVSLGDSAIEQINEEYVFNEEEFNKNTSILRTDIYYLELNRKKSVIDGKISISTINTPYALFFYNASSDECVGMNLSTQNRVYFKKVN